MTLPAPRAGFYGKLPSRGDFLRVSVPRAGVAAWDAWLAAVLPPVRERLGDSWDAVWRAAPAWRFALPAGLCGDAAASGVWRPSTDKSGRAFPLVVLVAGPRDDGFLDAAEDYGARAVAGLLGPEDLTEALARARPPVPPAGAEASGARWWRASARPDPNGFATPGWPDADLFLRMLTP